LLRVTLKAYGKRGVPQGGVISPLLSNVYLNEVDKMLERTKEVTRHPRWTGLEYCRFADDLVVLVSAHPQQYWLRGAVDKRLREEFAKLGVEVNEAKSRTVDLDKGESFGFLGFEFRRTQAWVERKIRRHLARARQRGGFGWKRWSRQWLYDALGLFAAYRVRYGVPLAKVAPV